MLQVLRLRKRHKAVDDRNDEQRKNEDEQDIDRCHDPEFLEQRTVRDNKGGKPRGRGDIGHKGGITDFGDHPL